MLHFPGRLCFRQGSDEVSHRRQSTSRSKRIDTLTALPKATDNGCSLLTVRGSLWLVNRLWFHAVKRSYTGLGHEAQAFGDGLIHRHLLGAILYAIGAITADCSPPGTEES